MDTYFEGFNLGEDVLARVINVFAAGAYHCFEIDGAFVCSRIDKEDFDRLRRSFQSLVHDKVPDRPTRTEIDVLAESIAFDAGVRELWSELVNGVAAFLRFAKPPGLDEEVLVAFGRAAEHVVLQVLEEADSPLHYSEVHQLILRRGADSELRRVHNALRQEGVFLFGRGLYGLRRHLHATESEVADVREMAEDIVLSADPDRQWHTSEILERLESQDDAPRTEFTAYELNIVLFQSKRLRYLNRMVWVADSSFHKDSTDRIDIAQACTTLLRDAGRPLTRSEILERLSDWRGVGDHFQLHGSENVVAVAPGVWGLRNRDLPLSENEILQFLDCLFSCLTARGKGLHQTEVKSELDKAGFAHAAGIEPYWAISLAGTDPRFRVAIGGYVGLADWEGPRRLTLTAAAKRLSMQLKGPESIELISQQLGELTEREVTRSEAINAIRGADFVFDEGTEMWGVSAETGE
jgi:hypothetical protein